MAVESVPSPDLSEYFRNSVDLLSVYQIGGKFGVLNPSWQRVLGWSPQDLEGHDFIDFVHPDDVKATIDENRAEWSDDSLTRAGFENRLRTRDGTYRWFEWTSQRRGDLIYATGRDVTLRKATFAELAANVEMTKAIFAAAADLIVIVNRDLVIARNSPRGQDFFGYGDDLALGASVFTLMHPDDRPAVEAALERMFEESTDEIVTLRYRVQHADGHWMVVESRGHTLGVDGGPATQAVFIARDLTESIAVEAQLAQSRETTRAILDAAIDSIIVIDQDLTILEANPGTQSLHGVAAADRVGRNVTELVYAEDREFVNNAFRTAFETDGPVEFRTRMNHVDGRIVTIEVRGRTLRDSDLAPTRLVFISRDVSESVAWEMALARSFAKTQAILDAAPDSIVVIDQDLMISEASPGTARIYGYPKEERIDHSAMTIVHPDDQSMIAEVLGRLFAKGSDESVSYRFRAHHADGHWLIIETHGRRLDDEDGQSPRAVLVSRDVTEAVAFEEALAAAKEEAERANAAKSEFMSRMSHELRTPLNSVLGFAQILQMELQSKEDLELVDHVFKSGQHLLTLINEVLDISRVESGNIGLAPEPVHLHALVHECLDIIGPQAKEREVGISHSDSFDYVVMADHLRLKQVILNLLSNAIKYNRSHGSVTLHCETRSLFVRFSVSDTGFGIAPELRERLFTAFDRLDAESRGIEGTGLGLTLSKTLIEAMGGTLGFETVVDEGSIFWFELPLSESAPGASVV
ncbi:MAG TPA: PAS domain S-box protein [Acidimicrobiales bacterium]|nr:PAS domain S-box protein [Acidimicrobiales bacterium]